ncbi:3-dehydroquinate synthase [Aneurinibacillus sp. Ricciae_BoGa-3]|uniref:3-dehydroquinate synthase n=1 Tax=Aneurinibacillus sp. Ricciae_BoGa-3 TaxID=3022697 RepID=UPI002341C213|nr:3-dehydroquinate synthase [Aneurinibacillus sp. Ricciae_BoGa-3]WCK56082.1 3-dehydroquinate synthase [Aneurinibacillus sp. Ricciae_BoGa-3]
MEQTHTFKRLGVDLGVRSYPIWIGEGVLQSLPSLLAQQGIGADRCLFIITDEHVAPLYLESLTNSLQAAGYPVSHAIVKPGEQAKSLTVFEGIVTQALEAGLDRKSVFVALGGGVVGDLCGYVAAAYMRGVDFVQVPTTLLAHDSSVGGKVAVNHPLGKNIIGAFHQPKLVAYDTSLLQTLPPREISAGYAEVVKHGLIWDESFVAWLEKNVEQLTRLDSHVLPEALYRAIGVKIAVVSQDERENGIRAILNLGHTFAHAIESLAGYSGGINHGEAVSIGMVAAARLAEKLQLANHVSERTSNLLKRFNLPTVLPNGLDADEMIKVMRRDKKGEGGKLVFVLPREVGRVEVVKDVPEAQVREVLEQMTGGEQ